MPKFLSGVLLVALAGLGAAAKPSGQAAGEGSSGGALRQIIPGHYVYSTTTFNSGVIATSEGVVVLDALATRPSHAPSGTRLPRRSDSRFAYSFRPPITTSTRKGTSPTATC